MKRFLVLSDLWPPFPGGAERLMFNLARDLLRRGHDVRAVTGYPEARPFDGPPVSGQEIHLDDSGLAIIQTAIDRHRPDVILTHHLYASVFAPQLAATGIPIVRLHYHGPRPDGAALVVHISGHVAREAGAHPDDLVLTPPVFDDVVAATHGDAIGFVKPYPHKGAALVYAIAAAMPDREFVVLRGEWPDLEVIDLSLANVRYLQPVVDIRDFWSQCRLALMPSLSEDAGTVAQEATANGLPCISSNVEGLAETNAGGIQIAPEGVLAWCAAIRYLDDPDVCAAVVRSQREGLAGQDHAGRLDDLAARIEAL